MAVCGWGLWPDQTHDSPLPFLPQPGSIDSNNQLFAPGGRLSWGKGSSGGSGAKPSDAGMEATVKSWVGISSSEGRAFSVRQACFLVSVGGFRKVVR